MTANQKIIVQSCGSETSFCPLSRNNKDLKLQKQINALRLCLLIIYISGIYNIGKLSALFLVFKIATPTVFF